jgi:hypothetical protein
MAQGDCGSRRASKRLGSFGDNAYGRLEIKLCWTDCRNGMANFVDPGATGVMPRRGKRCERSGRLIFLRQYRHCSQQVSHQAVKLHVSNQMSRLLPAKRSAQHS